MTPNKVRYGQTNPPSSPEEARRRKDELTLDIEKVTVALNVKTEGDFSCHREYTEWKKRASDALSHMRVEKKYLDQFLSKKPEKKMELAAFAEECVARYGHVRITALPPDMAGDNDKLRNRHNELVELKQTITTDLGLLKARSLEIDAPEGAYWNAKEKITRVLQAVEKELGLIKEARRVFHSDLSRTTQKLFDMKKDAQFLLSIIDIYHLKNKPGEEVVSDIEKVRKTLSEPLFPPV